MGDFNCVRNLHEKRGGRALNYYQIKELNCFIFSTGLKELEANGPNFSWRSGPAKNISSRIDRIFTNIQWLDYFPHSKALYLPLASSDHNPMFLQLHATTTSSPHPFTAFKFRNHWTQMEGYFSIVSRHFTFSVDVMLMQLIQMLKSIKFDLRSWAKNGDSLDILLLSSYKEVAMAAEKLDTDHSHHNAVTLHLAQKNLHHLLDMKANGLREEISHIRIYDELSSDQWSLSKVKSLSVAHIWEACRDNQANNMDFSPKIIWHYILPPKMRICMFRAFHNFLPTKNRIRDPNINNPQCVLCKDFPESNTHIFFQCFFSDYIWYWVRNLMDDLKCLNPNENSINKAFERINHSFRTKDFITEINIAAIGCTIL